MSVLKVNVISLPYIFHVFCFTRPRYQVSVYRTIGPLVSILIPLWRSVVMKSSRLFKNIENSIGDGLSPCLTPQYVVRKDYNILLAYLSRRLISELIVYPCSGVPRCRRRCCRPPFSKVFSSETA